MQNTIMFVDDFGDSKYLEYSLLDENEGMNGHCAVCFHEGFGDLHKDLQQELISGILEQHFSGQSLDSIDVYCEMKNNAWTQFRLACDYGPITSTISVLRELPQVGEYDIFISGTRPLPDFFTMQLNQLVG